MQYVPVSHKTQASVTSSLTEIQVEDLYFCLEERTALAREFVPALPIELTPTQWQELPFWNVPKKKQARKQQSKKKTETVGNDKILSGSAF